MNTTLIPVVQCRTCWHYTRGNYCGRKHENTKPSDACGLWQSRSSARAPEDHPHGERHAEPAQRAERWQGEGGEQSEKMELLKDHTHPPPM